MAGLSFSSLYFLSLDDIFYSHDFQKTKTQFMLFAKITHTFKASDWPWHPGLILILYYLPRLLGFSRLQPTGLFSVSHKLHKIFLPLGFCTVTSMKLGPISCKSPFKGHLLKEAFSTIQIKEHRLYWSFIFISPDLIVHKLLISLFVLFIYFFIICFPL